MLTIKSLSGRLSQRVGRVTVNDEKAALDPADAGQLSAAQQQSIGPVEGNAAFTVVQESKAEAITAVTHDGADGQMTRTRGALSFRMGDFFSGNDKEQMRLTEEGNLGIGTDKPQVRLDVAGMIRAGDGLMFSDGSTLKVNEKGVLTRTSADGANPDSVNSTQNRIAKFTDGAGTLGDSLLGETAGGVELRPAVAGVGVNPTLTNFSTVAGFSQMSFYPVAGPNTNMSFTVVPRGTGAANNRAQFSIFSTDLGASPINYEFASLRARGSDFVLGTGKSGTGVNRPFMFASGYLSDNTTNEGQFYLASNGNVGVGTTNPVVKLDVAGKINTTTQYDIGGNRVLTVTGSANTFAGIEAGTSSTGEGNSFFGRSAGGANTTGALNSFFGYSAGDSNTTGNLNAFFGWNAGAANTNGGSNSFFGADAGQKNTNGVANAFFGKSAGLSNTEGHRNSFFGNAAGFSNTTGDDNSFFGYEAGHNSTGDDNSFFGRNAGSTTTSGSGNAFFGKDAGRLTDIGSGNTFVGTEAGEMHTEGINNTFVGRAAGNTNTTGGANTIIGYNADVGSSGLVFATAIGALAVVNNSSSVVLGRAADTVRIPGDLIVTGTVSKGGGSFKIDHPLDPANKYLSHSFVESPT